MKIPKVLLNKLSQCKDKFINDLVLYYYFMRIYDGSCPVPSYKAMEFIIKLLENNKVIVFDDELNFVIEEIDEEQIKGYIKLFELMFIRYARKKYNDIPKLLDYKIIKTVFEDILSLSETDANLKTLAESIVKISDEQSFKDVLNFIVKLKTDSKSVLKLMLENANRKNSEIILNYLFELYSDKQDFLKFLIYDEKYLEYLPDTLKKDLLKYIDNLRTDELTRLKRIFLYDSVSLDKYYKKWLTKAFNGLLSENIGYTLNTILFFGTKAKKNINSDVYCMLIELLVKYSIENNISTKSFQKYITPAIDICSRNKDMWLELFKKSLIDGNCEFAEIIANKIYNMKGEDLFDEKNIGIPNPCYNFLLDRLLDI